MHTLRDDPKVRCRHQYVSSYERRFEFLDGLEGITVMGKFCVRRSISDFSGSISEGPNGTLNVEP